MARNEAKMALEWYHGYTDKDGEYHQGTIQMIIGRAEKLKEASDLGERFDSRTFASFQPRDNQTAFDTCRAYANNNDLFKLKKNGLILIGDIGTGKTHLSASISHVLIDRGIPVLFHTYSEHLDEIKNEFNNTGNKKYLSMMKTTPMVVIDDLGRERQSEWSNSILFEVINSRYEHHLPVIITSNLSATEIRDHVGMAVWSRLYEICGLVVLEGKDHRMTS